MKDSILLMDIYKRYLQTTSDLITILERNFDKENKTKIIELKKKYKEFQKHAHVIIENLNADLHKLLRLDWELKDLEEKIYRKEK